MQPTGSGRRELESVGEQAAGIATVASTASRLIRILSKELDPVLFDNEALVSELSRVARLGRQCEVRILVQSTQLLVKRRHRIGSLHMRLVSSVPVKKLAHLPEQIVSDYLLADDCGVFWIPRTAERVCFMNEYDRPLVKQLSEQFDELWFRALPDPELRVMPM